MCTRGWCVALVAAVLAVGIPPAGGGDLRLEVERALRRSALPRFSGTLSFEKEMWVRDWSGKDVNPTQTWEITIDEAGRLRSRAELGSSTTGDTWLVLVGDTLTHRWIAITWDHELLVLSAGTSAADFPEESRLGIMENLVRQSRAELNRLIGTPLEGKGIQFRLLEGDPTHPVAVIEVDGSTRLVECDRIGDTLVVASMLYADDLHSYRWTFSGHRQMAGQWVPQTAEFVQRDVHDRVTRSRYTNINLMNQDPEQVILNLRDVPDAEDEAFERLVMVSIFSKDGVQDEEFYRFDSAVLGR
jgi:hypothetical protein